MKANESHPENMLVKPRYRFGGRGEATSQLEVPENSREAAAPDFDLAKHSTHDVKL
jgi:hypothetical protein